MRSAFRAFVCLAATGLVSGLIVGCQGDDIPLAEVPAAKQPEPVPVEKLPADQRPPKNSSAAATLRYATTKHHSGPPR